MKREARLWEARLAVSIRARDRGGLERLLKSGQAGVRVQAKSTLNHVIKVWVSLLQVWDLQDVGKVLGPLAIARLELREGVDTEFEHLRIGRLPQS